MTLKYSQLGAGSILGSSPQAETLFPQSSEDGNNSFLRKLRANSKVALATGTFIALFAVNSAAKTISSEVDEDIGVVKIGMKMECLSLGVPDSTSIKYSSSDGTATASSSDSDGDYTAVDGVLTWDGDASDCGVTKFFDFSIYDDDIAEGNETVNFTFSNGDTAVLTIVDNDTPVTPPPVVDPQPQPTFEFSQSSYSLDEDAGVATIGVTISCSSGDNPDSVSVSYSSSDGGTAASDDDYTAVNGVLTWDANDCKTTQTFEVSIQDDSEAEDDETVNLSLNNGNGDMVDTVVLTIVDNDTPVTPPPVVDPQPLLPTFEFSQSSYSVDEGAKVATIEVTMSCLSGVDPSSLSVSYSSSDGGTAASDDDYTAVNGVLTWNANDCNTTQTFEVPIQDDSEFEKDEMLNLSLGNGNTAILTIVDNDAQDNQPPVVEPVPDDPKVEDDETVDLELDNGNTAELNDVPSTPVYSGGGGTSEMPTSIPDGGFSQNWNAGGQSLTDDIEIGESGSMTNAVVESQVINHGWVYSSHIEMGASISGGIISGSMTVEGSLTNFDFRGASINGRNEAGEIVGMLGGTIINNSKVGGYIENVLLAPNTSIWGGVLRNQIIGDANRPALLKNLKVWPGSKLDNVIIGPGVKLPKKVSLGVGVQIATQSFSINSLGNSIATETYSVETIRTSMKRQHNGVRLSQSVASSVQIESRMFVDRRHIGQAAERITVAYHQTTTTTTSYLCTGGSNWQVWDGEMGSLEAAEQYDSLPEDLEVPIFEGDLSELPGDFTVYNGYRLEDDSSITYNGDAPTQFSIVTGEDESADDSEEQVADDDSEGQVADDDDSEGQVAR